MKRRIASTLSVLVLGFAAMAGAAPNRPAPYAAIRAQLRASAVPVLLPLTIPHGIGQMRSVAVISAGKAGYYVGFSPSANCAGALSCAFFHVAGSRATSWPVHAAPGQRALRLADGTHATYVPRDCSGASCTEASLTFERFGASYEIDVKAGNDLHVLQSAYRSLHLLR